MISVFIIYFDLWSNVDFLPDKWKVFVKLTSGGHRLIFLI